MFKDVIIPKSKSEMLDILERALPTARAVCDLRVWTAAEVYIEELKTLPDDFEISKIVSVLRDDPLGWYWISFIEKAARDGLRIVHVSPVKASAVKKAIPSARYIAPIGSFLCTPEEAAVVADMT